MTSSSTNPLDETGATGERKAGQYYSYGIPYLSVGNYPGKLIAIEGTDGVGRSTQITLLREWLDHPSVAVEGFVPPSSVELATTMTNDDVIIEPPVD